MYRENTENNSRAKVIAIDLFCGAGGLTRGLIDAGIDVRLGIDYNDDFRKTYETNNTPARFSREDIKSLSAVDLERQLNIKAEEFFMLAACAPCQPFSRHNKNNRYDRRKSLLLEVGRILTDFSRKPDCLFIENVPAIAKIDDGKVIKEFCRIIENLGYNYKKEIVNAKDYGVPQKRKRFILIAIKKTINDAPVDFPAKIYGDKLLSYQTVRNAIGKLPPIKAGQKHRSIINHESAGLSEKNKKRLSFVPKNGGSRDSWPEDLLLECHKNHTGHKDVYGRMKWDAPSPTLTCKCTSISNGRYGHPSQLRAISLREAACLQTFPMSYEFYGKFQSKAMQIGNAVPVLLAKTFGEYLVGLLDNGDGGN